MDIKNEYHLRDELLDALNSTYTPDWAGKDWYICKYARGEYSVELNMQLTTDILAVYAFAHVDPETNTRMQYYGETMYRRILDIIWNAWPGGTTAESCARKVCKVLNVEVDE